MFDGLPSESTVRRDVGVMPRLGIVPCREGCEVSVYNGTPPRLLGRATVEVRYSGPTGPKEPASRLPPFFSEDAARQSSRDRKYRDYEGHNVTRICTCET